VIGVGEASGVLALGFGQMLKQDVESLLQGGAGHRESLSLVRESGMGRFALGAMPHLADWEKRFELRSKAHSCGETA
jgi:hypothetical protein